jgi:hypothetical protein
MSVTFDTQIAKVGYWLDEANIIGGIAGDMSGFAGASAQGKYFTNLAYTGLVAELPIISNRAIALKEGTIKWLADTELYTLPTDLYQLHRVEGGWDETDASKRYPIHIVDHGDRQLYYSNTLAQANDVDTTGGCCYIYIKADGTHSIGFLPIPTATKASANVKLFYWSETTELTLTGSTLIKWMEPHVNLIALKAALLILGKSKIDFSHLLPFYEEEHTKFRHRIRKYQQQQVEVADYELDDELTYFDT